MEEDIVQNYSPDVVQLTCTGIFRGHQGVREGSWILSCIPEDRFEYRNMLIDGEMAFLEWKGFSDRWEVREGADSFLIREGKIVVQTIHYKVNQNGADHGTTSASAPIICFRRARAQNHNSEKPTVMD